MENTIMTEKIARRGVKTPESYKPDTLEQFKVKDVMNSEGFIISGENKISEVRTWLKESPVYHTNYFIIVNNKGVFCGVISAPNLFNDHHDSTKEVATLVKRKTTCIGLNDSLRKGVEMMVNENIDLLPVVNEDHVVIGIICHRDILNAYKLSMTKTVQGQAHISLKRHAMKLLVKGHRLITLGKDNK